MLANSLNYIHKPEDAIAFHPNQLIPVKIKISSLGDSFDLRVTETYPSQIKIYDSLTGQWITESPWAVNIHLEPNDTNTILYYAVTPDRAGTYTLQTEVGYIENGNYIFYQILNTDILVNKDTAIATSDIISALSSLSVSSKEREKLDNAIGYIRNVQDRIILSKQEIDQNIQDILKAEDSLLFLTSDDTSAVRLMIDELLKGWESRYYLELI